MLLWNMPNILYFNRNHETCIRLWIQPWLWNPSFTFISTAIMKLTYNFLFDWNYETRITLLDGTTIMKPAQDFGFFFFGFGDVPPPCCSRSECQWEWEHERHGQPFFRIKEEMQEDQDEIRSIGKTQILVTRQNVSAKGKERGNYFFVRLFTWPKVKNVVVYIRNLFWCLTMYFSIFLLMNN